MCNCKEQCEDCNCKVSQETINEVIARILFDNNITLEMVSKKTRLATASLEDILQKPDSMDSELLLGEILKHYLPYYVKMKEM